MTGTCATCAYIRDDVKHTADPQGRIGALVLSEYYVRCGWSDGRALPIVHLGRMLGRSDFDTWITRKILRGEGPALPLCPTHQPKEDGA